MIYREHRIESWEAEHRDRIKWGCAKVGMSDVCENIVRHNKGGRLVIPPSSSSIILHYSDSMRTTRGRAWTHYGPHDYHHGSTKLVREQLQALHGKPRGGLIHWCIALYETASDSDRKENGFHELAHILANLEAGKSVGHKVGWKSMMRRLGVTPKRCHSQDTTHVKRRQRRYSMACPDHCGWSFTFAAARRTRRINDARKGSVRTCPKCKAKIYLQHWMNSQEV
jgi:predicted SprT family Zn-dependent metalloprotease